MWLSKNNILPNRPGPFTGLFLHPTILMLLDTDKAILIAQVITMFIGRQMPVRQISQRLNIAQVDLWYIIIDNCTYKTETNETTRLVLQSKINL